MLNIKLNIILNHLYLCFHLKLVHINYYFIYPCFSFIPLVLGHQLCELKECIEWMAVHCYIVDVSPPVEPREWDNVSAEEWYSIQTMEVSAEMLVRDCLILFQ